MRTNGLARNARRGQGLVEYILIVASVGLISLVAVSMFGSKVAQQYAVGAGMLPGANASDNNAIAVGKFAGTTETGGTISGNGQVSWAAVTGTAAGSGNLENNVVANGDNSGAAFVSEIN